MKTINFIFFLFFSCTLLGQAPGTLDPTFGTGGKVVTSFSSSTDKAYGAAIQPDGKIVVAGSSNSSFTGEDFICARYLTSGHLDSTFGTNGIVTTDVQLGSEDIAYDLDIQADGKIILAGYSDDGTKKDAALIRYNTDGSIDNTFGTNGKVLTAFEGSQQDEIKVVKIHPLTGKIIVGGSTRISTTVSKPVVARYLNNGALDLSFNSNGIRLLWITSLDYQYLYSIEDLAVQANGKISAVGWRDFPNHSWSTDYWIGRISSNGSMDNTFSTDGVRVFNNSFNAHDKAYAMLLESNNILLAGGAYKSNVDYDFSLREFSSTGSTTSLHGSVDFAGTLSNDIAYGLAKDNNGNYVLAGSNGRTSKSFALARFSPSGSIDNSFGTAGTVSTTFGSNTMNECFDVLIQTADNKIVAVGYTGNDIAIARYLGTGIPQLDDLQLTAPADLALNQEFANLALDWTDPYGATSYEVKLDSSQNFSSGVQTYTSQNSTFPLINLQPNTTYYWSVRALNGTSTGAWSNVWAFTTKENFDAIVKLAAIDFQLFPNPASNELNLEVPQTLVESSYRIINSVGKEVSNGLIKETMTTISLENLPTGMYYVHIHGVVGQPFQIIKQ